MVMVNFLFDVSGFHDCFSFYLEINIFLFFTVAAHPQVRRKLEDVSHKLDILYDKLRKQCLSPATLQGLHTILQHVWQYDYQGCMQVDIKSFLYKGLE